MDNLSAFSRITAALNEVIKQQNAVPSPTGNDKAKLDQSYTDLCSALGEIALSHLQEAAKAVASATQNLQQVKNAGLALSLAQGALIAIGAAHTGASGAAAALTPASATLSPDAAGSGGNGQMNAAGFALLREWEGCVLYAYDDANDRKVEPGDPIHGTLTIGYGHVGRDVFPGLVWTQAQAEQMLQTEVSHVADAMRPLIKTPLSDNEFSALVCFAYNIGTSGFAGSSALKCANAGDLAAVPDRIGLWIKTTVDGQTIVSQGLKDRRAAEIALWNTP